MLFELRKTTSGLEIGTKMTQTAASELGVKEKAIEDWIASHPEVLFQSEELLPIAQSISGHRMADILALDARGSLVIVEIKRDWSDRETVGQLLEYAASLRNAGYEKLNAEAQRYSRWPGGSLADAFRSFVDQEDFGQEDIGRQIRVIIVAPESDQSLRDIITWLNEYDVPISFVPFALYGDDTGQPRLLQMESAPASQSAPDSSSLGGWAGHWIFNTNETHSPGAWRKMFASNVAAIYDYESGPRNLEGASGGDKVLAYVNREGIRAIGTVVDGVVKAGTGIFEDPPGQQAPAEYHLEVRWDCIVSSERAVSASRAAALGYRLPVRSVFAKLQQGATAMVIEREFREACRNDQPAKANSR